MKMLNGGGIIASLCVARHKRGASGAIFFAICVVSDAKKMPLDSR